MSHETLDHLDDLAAVDQTSKRLGNYFTVGVFALQEFVPPAEEKIPSNEFKPGSERVCWQMCQ